MNSLHSYRVDFNSTSLLEQVTQFLYVHHHTETLQHLIEVADEAQNLAKKFDISEEKAYTAGLLHDISCVIPNEDRIAFSEELELEILPEEYQVPMILHQKQSVIIAEQIFDIHDKEILSAIEVHTTLKKNANELDKVVFLADKIKWDRNDSAPYLEELLRASSSTLDDACRVYINWLLNDVIVIHPWLKDAMDDLSLQ